MWTALLHSSQSAGSMWKLLRRLYGSREGTGAVKLAPQPVARGLKWQAGGVSGDALQAELPRVLAQAAAVLPLFQLGTAAACLLRARRCGVARPRMPCS